jgi:hypothetical protein
LAETNAESYLSRFLVSLNYPKVVFVEE